MANEKGKLAGGKKEMSQYKCKWCKYEFKQEVGTASRDKKNRASDQVPCPECGNFNKTWQV